MAKAFGGLLDGRRMRSLGSPFLHRRVLCIELGGVLRERGARIKYDDVP